MALNLWLWLEIFIRTSFIYVLLSHNGDPYHIETGPLKTQWTRFYMIGASVMKEFLKISHKPQNEFRMYFLRKDFLNNTSSDKKGVISAKVFNLIQNEIPRSSHKSQNLRTK